MSDSDSDASSAYSFTCQQLCDVNQTARCRNCKVEVVVPCFKESSGCIKCFTPKCTKGLQHYMVTWDIHPRSDAFEPPADSRFKCDDTDCNWAREHLGGVNSNETQGFCVMCLDHGEILWADGKVIYDDEIPYILQGDDQETVFSKTGRT